MKGKLVLMREETDLRDDASITAVRLSTTKNISIFQSRTAVRDSAQTSFIPDFCIMQHINETAVFTALAGCNAIRPLCLEQRWSCYARRAPGALDFTSGAAQLAGVLSRAVMPHHTAGCKSKSWSAMGPMSSDVVIITNWLHM